MAQWVVEGEVGCVRQWSILFNPRPDGIWRVTRSDEVGGGGGKGPLRIFKVIIVGEKFERRWKDLVELYSVNIYILYFYKREFTLICYV